MANIVWLKCMFDAEEVARRVFVSYPSFTRKDLDETPRSVNSMPQNADYWERLIGRRGLEGADG